MDFQSSNSLPTKTESSAALKRTTDLVMGRIGPKGNRKLKKLTNRHLRILTLHLSGEFSNVGVAREIGCTVSTVNRVIGDPLAQTLITDFRAGHLQELEALFPKAIGAVRKGLNSGDTKTSLLAVDRYLKMTGEDDDRRVGPNVSITVINARSRFVDTLKSAADIATVTLDQEPPDAGRASPSTPPQLEGHFRKVAGGSAESGN